MRRLALLVLLSALMIKPAPGKDSLPPLGDGKAPTNLDELWGNYDPRSEPLETRVVRQWKEANVTLRYVVFTTGTFRGRPARMAAFYAFPESDKKLPAILHVHGGGQRASFESVRNAARNGYAGLSINWGGQDMEAMQKDDPNTDWGALDATQQHNDHYGTLKPDPKTLDAVESPRNNNWFLLVLAARRGLTFLEQQPEVDPERLGVTGHSMGGKITVDVAGIDRRVKAAVPSCGGTGSAAGKLSGMPGSGLKAEPNDVVGWTIDDRAYIPRVTCPILFMAPTNDFAGPLDNLTENWRAIGSRVVAYTIAPHLNHRSIPETEICGMLWFDEHLQGAFRFPKTPELTVDLKAAGGVPHVRVTPDRPAEVARVDIYYAVDPHCLTRFWRDAQAARAGDVWSADCPVLSTRQPLYVYANVSYALKTQRTCHFGAAAPATFIISSKESVSLPEELQAAGVQATDAPSPVIDDFARGWHDWYRLEWRNPHVWDASTRKLKDPKWRGSAGARLVFDVKCPRDNTLVIIADVNTWGPYPDTPWATYMAGKRLTGAPDWQTVTVRLEEMLPTKKDGPQAMTTWETVTELSFRRQGTFFQAGHEVKFGEDSPGWPDPREFRNLHWEVGPVAASRSAGADAVSETKGNSPRLGNAASGRKSASVDVAAWVKSRAESIRAPLPPPRDEAEVAPLAEQMAAEQVRLWVEPDARRRDATDMRRKNPEWEFMGRSFVVWALANRCLRRPELKARYLDVIDRIIDDTLEKERANGVHYFLAEDARRRPFVAQPERSIFVDGEIALMLAARRLVEEKEAYRRPLAERATEMTRRMRAGSVLCAESHPDECWMFCNAVALAAIRLGDVLDATDHSAFFRDWLAAAKKKLIDSKTGLLVSTFRLDGRVTQGPAGSSIWMTAHCLQLIDPEFAADQYRRARKELGSTVPGLGYAREWPDSSKSQEDLDSGEVIPLLEASAASSGLALVAARAFDDRECFRDLQTSLGLLAAPDQRDGRLRFSAGNQVGNAVIFYAAVLGPLWKKAETRNPRRAP